MEFDLERAGAVEAAMRAAAESGTGWINFEPVVDVDDVPPESGTFPWFSGRGPIVPLATWTPGSTSRRGRVEPAMLGLQHPAGSKARPLLARRGHQVPPGWIVVQDHVRKGLVVSVPVAVSPEEALRWVLRAASLVSTIRMTGRWRASIYGG